LLLDLASVGNLYLHLHANVKLNDLMIETL